MSDTRNRVRRSIVLLGVVLAVVVVACSGSKDATTAPTGGGGGSGTPGSPAGSFALSTVNAKPLPYMMFSDTGYTLETTGGTFALQAGGKFTATITSRETIVGIVSIYVDSTFGTWSNSTPSTIIFTNTADGTTQNATWDGTKMTIMDASSSSTLVYTKSS
jgi:hypothetical protein